MEVLPREPLAQGFRHQMHEVHHPLPVLGGLLAGLLAQVGHRPSPVERDQHGGGADDESDEEG